MSGIMAVIPISAPIERRWSRPFTLRVNRFDSKQFHAVRKFRKEHPGRDTPGRGIKSKKKTGEGDGSGKDGAGGSGSGDAGEVTQKV